MSATRFQTPAELLDADRDARRLLDRIETRHNLCLKAWPTRRVAMVLAHEVDLRTMHGKTTAILAETELRKIQTSDLLGLCAHTQGDFAPRVFSRAGFLEALGNPAPSNHDWFSHLDLVVVSCVEDTLQRPFEWEHLCYRIHDDCVLKGRRLPQFLLVISPRDAAEGAVRRNFPVFGLNTRFALGDHMAHEFAFSGSPVAYLWWTLWAAEDAYLHQLMRTSPQVDYGVEPVLAYFSGQREVSPSHYRPDPGVPMDDQRELMQAQIEDAREAAFEKHVATYEDGHFIRHSACSAESVRDACGNPWRVLRSLADDGGEALLASIVVPPSLLRGYLVSNAGYFSSASTLEPLTPRMLNSLNDTVAQLYLRLKRGSQVELEEIRRVLERVGVAKVVFSDVFAELKRGFRELFGASVADRLRVETDSRWQDDADRCASGAFVRRSWVSLSDAKRSGEVDWLDELSVDVEGGASGGTVRRDHAWQLFGPGRQFCIEGKLFRGESVEQKSVRVAKDRSLVQVMTRCEYSVCVNDPLSRKHIEPLEPVKGDRFELRVEVLELPFRVASPSWWESSDFGEQWIQKSRPQPERVYRPGRALRVLLCSPSGEGQPLWTPAQRLAFAQWLNEAARTLLPESYGFMIAATSVGLDALPTTRPAGGITPQLSFVGETAEHDSEAVWIFEDSHADLGIVGACRDRIEWILNLCLDHLVWSQDEAGGVDDAQNCELNHRRLTQDFMAYGREAADAAFDFKGLRDVLENVGIFSARERITTHRHLELDRLRRRQGDASGGYEAGPSSGDMSCDFCGVPISTQGERLPDGRHRCKDCSETAIDTLSEAQQICERVLQEFPEAFGRRLDVPVSIVFASAHDIAARNGTTFLPTSAFDARAIGIACAEADGRYTIMIESGQRMAHFSMTLVHELTHVWQYVWSDIAQLNEQPGHLIITEGHASWAECRYARYKAAQASTRAESKRWEEAASRQASQLEQRSDEYGQGYRRFLQLVGAEGDAFGWLAGQYPKAV